mmetsp:Transcript_22597/g.53348  ORF Transcript_22597/g.53348 Transcript_22597/m.53348 type:complete len:84 (-) Transcript_22597:16-267(-)
MDPMWGMGLPAGIVMGTGPPAGGGAVSMVPIPIGPVGAGAGMLPADDMGDVAFMPEGDVPVFMGILDTHIIDTPINQCSNKNA